MNICSVIVNAKPKNAPKIRDILVAMDGVDVFGGVEEGKLITTLEDSGEKALADKMAAVNYIKGEIDVAMIYHQEANDQAMEEEIV